METDKMVHKSEFRPEDGEVQILILYLPLFYWPLFLVTRLTSVSLFPDLQQTIEELVQRKTSLKIHKCCFQTSLLRLCCSKLWQPARATTFLFLWAKSTMLPKMQQQSLHMERFLVLTELLHVVRKLKQIRCLLTAQFYLLLEQKDYNVPSILLRHHMGQKDFTTGQQRGKQRIWG